MFGRMGAAMRRIPHSARLQKGFTLLELLISLVLVLVLLISVQRYIAGVTVDFEGIAERRDQATQTRIALTNMQRDVAQAGYFPLASNNSGNSPAGVTFSGGLLTVTSFQPSATAVDCNGASTQYNGAATIVGSNNQSWVAVQNVYEIVGDSLTCNGNGGNNGRRAIFDRVVQMQVSNAQGQIASANSNSFVSVCIISREPSSSLGNTATTTLCDDATSTPNVVGESYFKVRVDMPVRATSFLAGQ